MEDYATVPVVPQHPEVPVDNTSLEAQFPDFLDFPFTAADLVEKPVPLIIPEFGPNGGGGSVNQESDRRLDYPKRESPVLTPADHIAANAWQETERTPGGFFHGTAPAYGADTDTARQPPCPPGSATARSGGGGGGGGGEADFRRQGVAGDDTMGESDSDDYDDMAADDFREELNRLKESAGLQVPNSKCSVARGRRRQKQLSKMSRAEREVESVNKREKARQSARDCRARKKLYINRLEQHIAKMLHKEQSQKDTISSLKKRVGRLESQLGAVLSQQSCNNSFVAG